MIIRKYNRAEIFRVVFLALLGVIVISGLTFASGGGEHGGAHDNKKLLDLLYRGINFALLVIILFVVLRKASIKDFFAARREEIKKKFQKLSSEKAAAEARYRELEEKLKEFETTKKEIIEQYKAEGIKEKERIISEAQERAAQILDQADKTIEREIQAARDRLMEQVVDSAAKKAKELIEKEIKTSDQDQLVNEFIEKVEKLH